MGQKFFWLKSALVAPECPTPVSGHEFGKPPLPADEKCEMTLTSGAGGASRNWGWVNSNFVGRAVLPHGLGRPAL
jgi:hypothetical protein